VGYKSHTQADELQQLALDIQKLSQLKSILSELYRGYTVVSAGYENIKKIAQGNFSLHKIFLDGLLSVSPTVRQYKKAADIIKLQLQLVKEYKSASGRFQTSGLFNSNELSYLSNVYSNLFNQSLKNLNALAMVLIDGQLRMSDAERLQSIDRIYLDMQDKLTFLRQFNQSTFVLALQRTKEQNDASTSKALYGIK
jgi:hypothetical protein